MIIRGLLSLMVAVLALGSFTGCGKDKKSCEKKCPVKREKRQHKKNGMGHEEVCDECGYPMSKCMCNK